MDIGLFVIDNKIQMKIADGDLAGDQGFETAIYISLFSDARASIQELPPGHTERRGWWADVFASNQGDRSGSKLWTLSRDKATIETIAKHETRAREALQWMIDDGVAQSIEVTASLDDMKRMNLIIKIKRPTGDVNRFSVVWDEQELLRA